MTGILTLELLISSLYEPSGGTYQGVNGSCMRKLQHR